MTSRQRLPLGQYLTDKFPVLHAGEVPAIDVNDWTLRLFGKLDCELTLTWGEFLNLPRAQYRCDIHCVTTWSRYDDLWEGVAFSTLLTLVKVDPRAKYVMQHAENDFTTNLPLEELLRPGVMLAHTHNGRPLTPEHGYPVRMLVPHLYFWKGAKWLRAIEFMEQDRPGYWEQRGYHMLGDPWVIDEFNPDGQRFRDDPLWFGDDDPAAMERWREDIREKRRTAQAN
ncbi:MAG: sulfite oxidase-like oxidoreductase [Firmicutes bacterium]|nr:sulfite oxidase-like oxidoreductase [Bacillota bacterium]